MRSQFVGWGSALASIFALLACGAPDGANPTGDVEEVADDEVGEATQALGGWAPVYTSPTGESMHHVGPTYSLAARRFTQVIPGWGSLYYDVPEIVLTATGQKPTVTQLPFELLPTVRHVASDTNNLVFFSPAGWRMYVYQPASPTTGSWNLAAILGNDALHVESAYLNATHVYADTLIGIFQIPLDGDLPQVGIPANAENATLVPNSQNWRLLAVNGEDIYVAEPGTSSVEYIKRVNSSGVGPILAVSRPGARWYASSGPNDYFTDIVDDNGVATNRIRRLVKATGAISTVKSSSTVNYTSVFATGSALYWRQVQLSDGAKKIVRMNLSNGNHVSTEFPFTADSFAGTASGIYVRSNTPGIHRGDL